LDTSRATTSRQTLTPRQQGGLLHAASHRTTFLDHSEAAPRRCHPRRTLSRTHMGRCSPLRPKQLQQTHLRQLFLGGRLVMRTSKQSRPQRTILQNRLRKRKRSGRPLPSNHQFRQKPNELQPRAAADCKAMALHPRPRRVVHGLRQHCSLGVLACFFFCCCLSHGQVLLAAATAPAASAMGLPSDATSGVAAPNAIGTTAASASAVWFLLTFLYPTSGL